MKSYCLACSFLSRTRRFTVTSSEVTAYTQSAAKCPSPHHFRHMRLWGIVHIALRCGPPQLRSGHRMLRNPLPNLGPPDSSSCRTKCIPSARNSPCEQGEKKSRTICSITSVIDASESSPENKSSLYDQTSKLVTWFTSTTSHQTNQ